jgi:hypothetical protein
LVFGCSPLKDALAESNVPTSHSGADAVDSPWIRLSGISFAAAMGFLTLIGAVIRLELMPY